MDKRDHEDSAKVGATKRARTDEKEDEIEPIETARPTIPAAAEGLRINTAEELKSKEEKQSQGPFHDLKIASHDYLKTLDTASRTKCGKCNMNYKFYCYTCLLPIGDPQRTPRVVLPVHCDILHWPSENLSKSTAVHAKVLAPDSVSFHEYPTIPSLSPTDTLLLYPSKTAQPIEQIDMSKIKHVVFIDSQWQQAKKILRDPIVQALPHVKIDSQKTLFWRYQTLGDEALATIEAIYYFYREYEMKVTGKYNGEYDNLLYFYSFLYNLIQSKYKGDTTKTFSHKKNYIKYDD